MTSAIVIKKIHCLRCKRLFESRNPVTLKVCRPCASLIAEQEIQPVDIGWPYPAHTLDKQAFMALSKSQRILHYLLLVSPEPRSTRILARVCGIDARDVASYASGLVRQRRVQHPARGFYAVAD